MLIPVYAFIAIAMLFGGGPGGLNINFILISAAGFVLLIGTIYGSGWQKFQQLPPLLRVALILIPVLPLLQIIPLPPALWQSLPGQALRADLLVAEGLGSYWLPLSLTPTETAYSAIIAICAMGLIVALLDLTTTEIRAVLWLVSAMIGLGALIGIIQYAANGDVFAFYPMMHRGVVTGFFANKNHMALTMACLIPMIWVLNEDRVREDWGSIALIAAGAAGALAILAATDSRAGLALGAGVLVVLTMRRFPQHRKKLAIAFGSVIALLAVIGSQIPTIAKLTGRITASGSDMRGSFLEQSAPLALQFFPSGSGLGSFAHVYPVTEQLVMVNPLLLNHVHNDIVQLIIEGGALGLISLAIWGLALGQTVWGLFVVKGQRMPLPGAKPDDVQLAWLGCVIIVMFGLHSVVDYPMRRVACLAVFCLAVAIAVRPFLGVSSRPALSS